MPLLRSANELLELERAVRYPGPGRQALVIAAVGGAATLLAFALTFSPWGSIILGVVIWLVGAVLIVGRDNRVMDVALRIFDEHPWCTAEEAANAARKELGLRAVRYPLRE